MYPGLSHPVEFAHVHHPPRGESQLEADGDVAFSVRCMQPGFGVVAGDLEVFPLVWQGHLYMVDGAGAACCVCAGHDHVAPAHAKMRGDWFCIFEYMVGDAPWSRMFRMRDGDVVEHFVPSPNWVLAAGEPE